MTSKNKNHPKLPNAKTGVLLVNLGTPDDLSYGTLRKYLAEFLGDPRVVDLPRFLWLPLLHGVLLNFIPFKSRRNYKPIWNYEKNESPLLTITKEQTAALQKELKDDVVVKFAMRYGNPSIESVMKRMSENGVKKLLVVPLYPQYSAVTTASVMDAIFDTMKTLRWQPTLRTLHPYFDEEVYINALAESYKAHIKKVKWQPDVILASYHGIPQRYFKSGDPYHCHCMKTTRLLKEKLNLPDSAIRTTFQSRFGKAPWLQPYTDETVKELAQNGTKNIAIITPGFAADCVETIGEIDIEAKEEFLEHGGKNFTYIPCLNASKLGISMLKTLILKDLEGWI
jgi:ferrochelatase